MIRISSIEIFSIYQFTQNHQNIIIVMKDDRKSKHKKRYSKISTQKRFKLVQMVLKEGLTLTKVAKLLHIKRPTAKVILKRYNSNGTFFHKNMGQLKTKESIGSNNTFKVEQESQQDVSIQQQIPQQNKIVASGFPPPVMTYLERPSQRISFLYLYPFPPCPTFM